MKRRHIVIGEYGHDGYTVGTPHGRVLYTAGNSPYDSTAVMDKGDPDALTLRQIRAYCIRATRDLATEQGAEYGGVRRVELE